MFICSQSSLFHSMLRVCGCETTKIPATAVLLGSAISTSALEIIPWLTTYARYVQKGGSKGVFRPFCAQTKMASSSVLLMTAFNIASNKGVPTPVAGSQPSAQLKPYLIGPVPRPIAFVP